MDGLSLFPKPILSFYFYMYSGNRWWGLTGWDVHKCGSDIWVVNFQRDRWSIWDGLGRILVMKKLKRMRRALFARRLRINLSCAAGPNLYRVPSVFAGSCGSLLASGSKEMVVIADGRMIDEDMRNGSLAGKAKATYLNCFSPLFICSRMRQATV